MRSNISRNFGRPLAGQDGARSLGLVRPDVVMHLERNKQYQQVVSQLKLGGVRA